MPETDGDIAFPATRRASAAHSRAGMRSTARDEEDARVLISALLRLLDLSRCAFPQHMDRHGLRQPAAAFGRPACWPSNGPKWCFVEALSRWRQPRGFFGDLETLAAAGLPRKSGSRLPQSRMLTHRIMGSDLGKGSSDTDFRDYAPEIPREQSFADGVCERVQPSWSHDLVRQCRTNFSSLGRGHSRPHRPSSAKSGSLM